MIRVLVFLLSFSSFAHLSKGLWLCGVQIVMGVLHRYLMLGLLVADVGLIKQ
jgi:hypothetical protein